MALVAVLLFALVDIVIIDWLIICTWRPAAIVFPGTEHCARWRDYGFHVRAQFELRGVLVLLISSAVIGGIAWLLT